jgi:excisionase family DNA binding protein
MDVRERTVLPPTDDASMRALLEQLTTTDRPELRLSDGRRLPLPDEVAEVLLGVVNVLAEGQAVTVAPQHTTLTTQQAAEMLGVSRPTLVKLLEAGALPYSQPGRHRRVRLSDVLAYRSRIEREREQALDELASRSQEAGLYADEVSRIRLRR